MERLTPPELVERLDRFAKRMRLEPGSIEALRIISIELNGLTVDSLQLNERTKVTLKELLAKNLRITENRLRAQYGRIPLDKLIAISYDLRGHLTEHQEILARRSRGDFNEARRRIDGFIELFRREKERGIKLLELEEDDAVHEILHEAEKANAVLVDHFIGSEDERRYFNELHRYAQEQYVLKNFRIPRRELFKDL